jgi:sugar (pentulose or hexulose) kinase
MTDSAIQDRSRQAIRQGRTSLGIEFGSTRIKAVLIGEDFAPLASGGYDWENTLENGYWTYSLDQVWTGLAASYRALAADVNTQYGVRLERVGSIGISAMMHGYLAFGGDDELLVPFRTWRNTTTERAAQLLTERFGFNIPQRWSIAHLYQAMLDEEEHVRDIAFFTTLAGYVHWRLTGERVLGVGDASGVFPIDSARCDYDEGMLRQFGELVEQGCYAWNIDALLPRVLSAGDPAGTLSEDGARLLDPSGALEPGIPLCPPEGDAGTGMTATNAVAQRTGNVSAGTSIFAMVVLEKPLGQVYTEIDMVTTPTGKPVAMVHCNSCTSDLDAWVKLLGEFAEAVGAKPDKNALYAALYQAALRGDADGGGLLSYNYYSGEPITGLAEGRPLFARMPDSRLSLGNFARTLLYSAMGTLKLGMAILTDKEQVRVERLLGHGGMFKVPHVGQQLMAGALDVPVAVMSSAGEGGAWGIALLAAYLRLRGSTETLEQFLDTRVFAGDLGTTAQPDPADTEGFAAFMRRYEAGLLIERAAVDQMKE